MKLSIKYAACVLIGLLTIKTVFALPAGFVYLSSVDPGIKQDIRYYSTNNFVGKRINGYQVSTCILTTQAANALKKVQRELHQQGRGLLVYDCYRPARAVAEFVAWSKNPRDQKNKAEYYPDIHKPDLFKKGYIAEKSGHSRGSTVDLTIVEGDQPLPMGTHFDFLDPVSNPLSPHITGEAKENRMLLRNIMEQYGFTPLETEWWHFSLKDEPYPDQYFNFVVR